MKCQEPGCNGEINFKKSTILPKRCSRFPIIGYPCYKCGRLHSGSGKTISEQTGKRAFLIDGEFVLKDEELVN